MLFILVFFKGTPQWCSPVCLCRSLLATCCLPLDRVHGGDDQSTGVSKVGCKQICLVNSSNIPILWPVNVMLQALLFFLQLLMTCRRILDNTDRHICSGIVANCSWSHASNWCHSLHCTMHQVPVPMAKSAGVAPGYLVAWASVLGTVSCHRSSATVSETRRTDALLQ